MSPKIVASRIKEILDKIDDKGGMAYKNHIKAEVFGGSEEMFDRWVEKYCIEKLGLLKKEEKSNDKKRRGKEHGFVKTDTGEKFHNMLKEHPMELFKELGGNRLKIR